MNLEQMLNVVDYNIEFFEDKPAQASFGSIHIKPPTLISLKDTSFSLLNDEPFELYGWFNMRVSKYAIYHIKLATGTDGWIALPQKEE